MAERTGNFKNISRRVSDNQWENATDMITPTQWCEEVMFRSDPKVPWRIKDVSINYNSG